MKRVAFIDRAMRPGDCSNEIERRRFEENITLVKKLREQYDIKCFHCLHTGTLKEMIEDAKANGFYHGIITHVPAQALPPYMAGSCAAGRVPWSKTADFMYKPSRSRIASIHKEFPEAKIIAYTGAGDISVPDYSLEEIGVSLVIRRKTSVDNVNLLDDTWNIILALKD